MGRRFSSRASLSLAEQNLQVRRRFPGFSYTWERGEAVWRGRLQPRETSPSYSVVIRYRLGKVPTVKITSPALRADTPHLYAGNYLCLYWPREWRWNGQRVVAESIIPWTSLWLFYYELWCDTGEWLGPSSPHGPGSKDEERPGLA